LQVFLKHPHFFGKKQAGSLLLLYSKGGLEYNKSYGTEISGGDKPERFGRKRYPALPVVSNMGAVRQKEKP